mgnify:CR=1 FL=1
MKGLTIAAGAGLAIIGAIMALQPFARGDIEGAKSYAGILVLGIVILVVSRFIKNKK